MDRDRAREIVDRTVAISDADSTEAVLCGGREHVTRFAGNRIHQNVFHETYNLSVRVQYGNREGAVDTTRLDEDGIRTALSGARAIAMSTPPCDRMLPMTPACKYEDVDSYDPSTALLDPDARADAVVRAIERCRRRRASAAGSFRVTEGRVGYYRNVGQVAVGNTNGLFAFHVPTCATFTITAELDDSSGWATATSWRAADIDPEALAERAVEKALLGRNRRSVPPGPYTVILEPAAVADLMEMLVDSFNARTVEEARSFFTGRLGEEVFGRNIDIVDDFTDPRNPGCPFDGEGVPRKRVDMIRGGVHRGLVSDRRTARALGIEPTGHGFRPPNEKGAYPENVVMSGSDESLDAIAETVDLGIRVTRFWYNRYVDFKRLIITGMTRDGTFLVRQGQVAHAIPNLRFNQSLPDLFRHVVALSRPERVGDMVVPGLVAEGFLFTSLTRT